MGKQRRGRGGSANQGGGTWAFWGGHAGKGNRAAKVYAGVRPAQTGLEQGNAIIVVVARQGGHELDRWQGPMNWPAGWDPLPLMFTGERADEAWQWSDKRAARVCLDTETPVGCGIAIEPWADQLGATELSIRIVANPGAATADASARGLGTQGQDTGQDTGQDARERTPGHAPGAGDASRSVDQAFRDMFANILGDRSREAGHVGAAGLGEQGAGAAQSMSGERPVSGRGRDAGQTASKPQGEPGGSRTPSWYTRPGAAVNNEWGGRTPDLEHGKSGGSAGGRQGGQGNFVGIWNGPIDIAGKVAIAVNVAIVLLDADVQDLGKRFLGKVVRGLGGKELRKELAGEAARAIDDLMPAVEKQLAADPAYRAMSGAEKQAALARARQRLEHEYRARAQAYFAAQAERSEAMAQKHADQAGDLAAHERQLAADNARAYRELERAAADSGVSTTPRGARNAPEPSERAGTLPRFDGPKPRYHVNSAHVRTSPHFNARKTPLPADAEEVFQNAVPDSATNPRNWYGMNSEGRIYRFSGANDGTAHFSGMEGDGAGIRNITDYALRRLGR